MGHVPSALSSQGCRPKRERCRIPPPPLSTIETAPAADGGEAGKGRSPFDPGELRLAVPIARRELRATEEMIRAHGSTVADEQHAQRDPKGAAERSHGGVYEWRDVALRSLTTVRCSLRILLPRFLIDS